MDARSKAKKISMIKMLNTKICKSAIMHCLNTEKEKKDKKPKSLYNMSKKKKKN